MKHMMCKVLLACIDKFTDNVNPALFLLFSFYDPTASLFWLSLTAFVNLDPQAPADKY